MSDNGTKWQTRSCKGKQSKLKVDAQEDKGAVDVTAEEPLPDKAGREENQLTDECTSESSGAAQALQDNGDVEAVKADGKLEIVEEHGDVENTSGQKATEMVNPDGAFALAQQNQMPDPGKLEGHEATEDFECVGLVQGDDGVVEVLRDDLAGVISAIRTSPGTRTDLGTVEDYVGINGSRAPEDDGQQPARLVAVLRYSGSNEVQQPSGEAMDDVEPDDKSYPCGHRGDQFTDQSTGILEKDVAVGAQQDDGAVEVQENNGTVETLANDGMVDEAAANDRGIETLEEYFMSQSLGYGDVFDMEKDCLLVPAVDDNTAEDDCIFQSTEFYKMIETSESHKALETLEVNGQVRTAVRRSSLGKRKAAWKVNSGAKTQSQLTKEGRRKQKENGAVNRAVKTTVGQSSLRKQKTADVVSNSVKSSSRGKQTLHQSKQQANKSVQKDTKGKRAAETVKNVGMVKTDAGQSSQGRQRAVATADSGAKAPLRGCRKKQLPESKQEQSTAVIGALETSVGQLSAEELKAVEMINALMKTRARRRRRKNEPGANRAFEAAVGVIYNGVQTHPRGHQIKQSPDQSKPEKNNEVMAAGDSGTVETPKDNETVRESSLGKQKATELVGTLIKTHLRGCYPKPSKPQDNGAGEVLKTNDTPLAQKDNEVVEALDDNGTFEVIENIAEVANAAIQNDNTVGMLLPGSSADAEIVNVDAKTRKHGYQQEQLAGQCKVEHTETTQALEYSAAILTPEQNAAIETAVAQAMYNNETLLSVEDRALIGDVVEQFAPGRPKPTETVSDDQLVDEIKLEEDTCGIFKIFPCYHCTRVFARRHELKQHLPCHTNINPFFCKHCGREFLDSNELNIHKELHKSHTCNTCGKRFAKSQTLTVHQATHTGIKPFSCQECGKRFAQLAHLKQHTLIHSGIKAFSCDCCGRTFARQGNRDMHKLVHFNDKPYSCTRCGKAFKRIYTLAVHERIHKDIKPFGCSRCGKRFRQTCHLKEHEKIHADMKPFACTVCGKRFRQFYNFKTHERTHTKERNYPCTLCPKRYSISTSLKHHMMFYHMGIKAFGCNRCGRSFRSKRKAMEHADEQCSSQ